MERAVGRAVAVTWQNLSRLGGTFILGAFKLLLFFPQVLLSEQFVVSLGKKTPFFASFSFLSFLFTSVNIWIKLDNVFDKIAKGPFQYALFCRCQLLYWEGP